MFDPTVISSYVRIVIGLAIVAAYLYAILAHDAAAQAQLAQLAGPILAGYLVLDGGASVYSRRRGNGA